MLKSIRWVLPIGLLLCWCHVASFAQTPATEEPAAEKQEKKSLFSRFNFLPEKKPPEPKLTPREKEDATKAKLNAQAIAEAKMAALLRANEEQTLHRRQGVCEKLLAIAVRTNDEKLAQMAEQLMDMAWEAYCKKTNSIGRSAGQSMDQSILRSHLNTGSNAPAGGLGGDGQFAARKEQ